MAAAMVTAQGGEALRPARTREAGCNNERMTRTRVAIVVAVVAALALALWAFTRAPLVPAVQVQAAPLVRTLQFSARVATTSRVDVGATLTGRVAGVSVREGTRVRSGDVLLRLETDELQAAQAQAEAGERQAAARLAGLRSTGRSAVQAQLEQAEATLRNAQAELERAEDLVARGFVSASRADDARRAVAVAGAQRDSARAQVASLGDSGTDIVQAQAQLALARSRVQAARARLAQATVSAPADARVLARNVEPGQIVQPGRALLTLALAGPVQLVAQVDERYLEQLRPGQAAAVLADAFAGQGFGARVRSIAPLVDVQRGSVEVKLDIAEPVPDFLREDMTISVEVETARRDQAIAIPLAALRGNAQGAVAQVLVLEGGKGVARSVQLGLRTLSAAEVRSGLAAGEVVLIGRTLDAGRRMRADFEAGRAVLAPGVSAEDAGAAVMNAMGR
jgi:HlyD family secretion protein